jgi:hypothetical protein
MISIKPVLKNVNLSIRDNLDPDPNDNRGKWSAPRKASLTQDFNG